jgi:glycosyltransferase involved in cell wall biosynthesis
MTPVPPLVLLAKSRWRPTIRREHALALTATGAGHAVSFVEAPRDVRSVADGGVRRWATALARPRIGTLDGVTVAARSTVVPGHRHRVAARVDNGLLRHSALAVAAGGPVVVCQVPWDWPATAGIGSRRVFDCSDDWTALLPPARTRHLRGLLARIAAEADAVVVVSPELAGLFTGRHVVTVPNGVEASLVAATPASPPSDRRLVHVGTFSERFDVDLVDALLTALPAWHLDLYGPCRYAGLGDRPAPALTDLLARHSRQARWHGPIPRSGLAAAIDRADVVVIPNLRERSCGQSSMKLVDAAARGRPVVASAGVWPAGGDAPPPAYVEATTVAEWVDAVTATPPADAVAQVGWAAERTWARRWPAWADAVFADT